MLSSKVKIGLRAYLRCGSHQPKISTLIGVGLNPLQGLLTCGQFEITNSTSISAVTSTWLPGAEMPSTTVKFPDASIGTFMKKFRFETMSRLVRPCLESSRMKFSRQACWYLVASPKRTALLSQEQQPADVSCRPQESAVILAITRPLLEISRVPSSM